MYNKVNNYYLKKNTINLLIRLWKIIYVYLEISIISLDIKPRVSQLK